jgi:hypothetical protein
MVPSVFLDRPSGAGSRGDALHLYIGERRTYGAAALMFLNGFLNVGDQIAIAHILALVVNGPFEGDLQDYFRAWPILNCSLRLSNRGTRFSWRRGPNPSAP